MPARDAVLLVELLSLNAPRFAGAVETEVRDERVEHERVAELRHPEPQVVVHRVVQRLVQRTGRRAEVAAPEDGGLADEVLAEQAAEAVAAEQCVLVTRDVLADLA